MLKTHYRQPIDWTRKGTESGSIELGVFEAFTEGVRRRKTRQSALPDELLAALADDLNTPLAITILHKLAEECRTSGDPWSQSAHNLLASCDLLGLDLSDVSYRKIYERQHGQIDESKIENLIEARNAARMAKNFRESDRIRDELAKMGVVLKDSKEGTTWEITR
jgi:cysteinyl-tRNA synthetase